MAARRGHRRIVQAEFGQRRAGGEAQLRLHDVHAGHFLGDGVLHLQAGVGLDEHERLAAGAGSVHQKLEGAEVLVAFAARETHGGVDDGCAQFVGQRRGGRDFHDLLMPPLDAAFALAQVRHVALGVAENLHFHMPRLGQEALHVDVRQAERGLGFGLAALEGALEFVRVGDDARAASAAAGHGLDDHRAAVQRGEEVLGFLKRDSAVQPLDHRHVRGDGRGPGAALVAEQFQVHRSRADEGDAASFAAPREAGAFGKEAVARMDGVAAGGLGRLHHAFFVQVGRRTQAGEAMRFVRNAGVQAGVVVFGIHGDRANAEVGSRARDSDGDLAAIGDQQGVEGASFGFRRIGIYHGRKVRPSKRRRSMGALGALDKEGRGGSPAHFDSLGIPGAQGPAKMATPCKSTWRGTPAAGRASVSPSRQTASFTSKRRRMWASTTFAPCSAGTGAGFAGAVLPLRSARASGRRTSMSTARRCCFGDARSRFV